MEENIYCVYRHIRQDKNEVFYIGIGDIDRPYERIGRNRHWISIVKLNPEYEVEILFENLSWEECCTKEKEFIKLYGRADLGLGTLCNLTDGGDGTLGRKHSKHTIEKIRQGNLGKSLSHKRIEQMRKDVAQLSLNGELIEIYPSIREAERRTGVKNTDITSICKGYKNAQKAGGFVWCYIKDLEITIERLKINPIKEDNTITVMQLTATGELIKQWDRISDVYRELNLHVTSITALCRGRRKCKSVGGFVWCYKQDFEDTVLKLKTNPVRVRNKTPVLQLSTDGVFIKQWGSLKEVAENLHIIADTVAAVCQGKYGRKTAGGFIWKYAA